MIKEFFCPLDRRHVVGEKYPLVKKSVPGDSSMGREILVSVHFFFVCVSINLFCYCFVLFTLVFLDMWKTGWLW